MSQDIFSMSQDTISRFGQKIHNFFPAMNKYGYEISERRFVPCNVDQDNHVITVAVLIPKETVDFNQLLNFSFQMMRPSPASEFQSFYVVELNGRCYVVSPVFGQEDGRFLGFSTPGHSDRVTRFGIHDNGGVVEFGGGSHKFDVELRDLTFVGFVETDIFEVVFATSHLIFTMWIKIPENFCKFYLATNGFAPLRIEEFFEDDRHDLRNPVVGKKAQIQAFYQDFFYSRFPTILQEL